MRLNNRYYKVFLNKAIYYLLPILLLSFLFLWVVFYYHSKKQSFL